LTKTEVFKYSIFMGDGKGGGGVNVDENRSFGNVQFCTFACRPVNILHINIHQKVLSSQTEAGSRNILGSAW
jgi:hypothetical protein